MASTLNVENVVKPPKKPVVAPSFSHSFFVDSFTKINANNRLPLQLMNMVMYGNPPADGKMSLSIKRVMEPSIPPIPTAKLFN